jgi:hypothetical protein
VAAIELIACSAYGRWAGGLKIIENTRFGALRFLAIKRRGHHFSE